MIGQLEFVHLLNLNLRKVETTNNVSMTSRCKGYLLPEMRLVD